MTSQPLRFEVKTAEYHGSGPAALGLVGGLVNALLSNGSGPAGGSGGTSSGTIRKYPEIAVYNSIGRRRVLDVLDTDEEAERRAAVIEEDFRVLDIVQWCKRYDVPLSFAEESGSSAGHP
jgi:hypothetical protein